MQNVTTWRDRAQRKKQVRLGLARWEAKQRSGWPSRETVKRETQIRKFADINNLLDLRTFKFTKMTFRTVLRQSYAVFCRTCGFLIHRLAHLRSLRIGDSGISPRNCGCLRTLKMDLALLGRRGRRCCWWRCPQLFNTAVKVPYSFRLKAECESGSWSYFSGRSDQDPTL
jgi:hypothetical protein